MFVKRGMAQTEFGGKKKKTVPRWLEVMPKNGLYSLDNGMSLKNIR